MMDAVKFISGVGQLHTNEPDPEKPKKILKPYLSIGIADIQALVDNPPTVSKPNSQWIMASSYPSRVFKEQEQHGSFQMLWADLDNNPPPIAELAVIVEKIIGNYDYELYNTASATPKNQKARLLIWLDEPMKFPEWLITQEILNEKLESFDVIPDDANLRAGQLCYLPNRGAIYNSASKRGGHHERL
ncbi:MAG: hypothetical protein QX199_15305 [Methylococcaceae bacterium]